MKGLPVLCLTSVCAAMLLSQPLCAATYYVRNGGDDANTGLSDGQAWESVAKVNAQSFSPGDAVRFRRGDVWREKLMISSSGTSDRPITVGAYGSGPLPRISGGDVITGWSGSNPSSAAFPVNPEVVVVDGEVWDDRSSTDALEQHTWCWANNTLYLMDTDGNPDTNGKIVEAGRRDRLLMLSSVDHVTVEDIEFDTAIDTAVDIWDCNHITFTGLHVRAHGQVESGSGAFGFSESRHLRVLHCRFTDMHRGKAFMFWNTSDAEVGHCVSRVTKIGTAAHNGLQISGDSMPHNNAWIHDNDFDHRPTFHTGAEPVKHVFNIGDGIGGTNAVIERNVIRGGAGGIQLGISGSSASEPVVVRYNDIQDNLGPNITTRDQGNRDMEHCLIHHNILVNGNVGIDFWDAGGNGRRGDFRIYNNTILGWKYAGIQIRSPMDQGSKIMNNIVWSTTTRVRDSWALRIEPMAFPHEVELDYNCWGDLKGRKGLVRWMGTNYDTLAEYQAVSLQDAHSMAIDPSIADAEADDFRLQAASPCIDAGVDVGLSLDYGGQPVPHGGGPDMGAFEGR